MLFLLVFFLLLLPSEALHHDIYWNSSNPLFEPFDYIKDTPGYYEIQANPSDILKIHCPKGYEMSIIYQVSYDDFLHCVLGKTAIAIGTCTGSGYKPINHKLKQFFRDSSNYYITTSTGDLKGMTNDRLGLCLEKNMRLAVNFNSMNKDADGLPYDIEIHKQRSKNKHLYLAEENGSLNWKMNVHPAIEKEWDLDMSDKQKNPKQKGQMEPIMFTEDFVSRLDEYRRRHELTIGKPKVRSSEDDYTKGTGVLTTGLVIFVYSALSLIL